MKRKKVLNLYIILHGYGEYGREFEVRAKNIFEALKKATDIIKKRMCKKGFDEKTGCDISLRIWNYWG